MHLCKILCRNSQLFAVYLKVYTFLTGSEIICMFFLQSYGLLKKMFEMHFFFCKRRNHMDFLSKEHALCFNSVPVAHAFGSWAKWYETDSLFHTHHKHSFATFFFCSLLSSVFFDQQKQLFVLVFLQMVVGDGSRNQLKIPERKHAVQKIHHWGSQQQM